MFMFLRVKFVLTAKGRIMKIHKQAAIKTVIIVLSFFILSLSLTFIIINIPSNWILPIFGIVLLGIIIHAIYRVILNGIEWEEQMQKREEEWKKIDAERYTKKMIQDEFK